MKSKFTVVNCPILKGIALMCILSLGLLNSLSAQVTISYQARVNRLYGGVDGDCFLCGGPDNHWLVRISDNQWSTGWSTWDYYRENDDDGWRSYSKSDWRTATSAPYGTVLTVQLDATEDDGGGWGGGNDGDCPGYATVNTVTTTSNAPCQWKQYEGSRSDCEGKTWKVDWSYYWYYTGGFSAGSINGTQTICSGGDPGLLGSASNGTTGNYIGYQWQYLNGSTWTDITTSGTSSTYNPPSGLTATRSYRRLVKADQSCNAYSVASNTITVTVAPPSVGGTLSPATQTVCASAGCTQTLPTLSGHTGSVVRWEYKSPTGSFTDWGGGGSTTAPNGCVFTTVGTWQVRAVVQSSPCTEAYSSTVNVVVAAEPNVSIALTSGSASYCGSGASTLTATGTGGTGTATYQWQYYNGSTWVNTGANSTTLATGTLTATRQYRCLYNTSGTNCTQATSNTITITINSIPNASISVSETSGTDNNDGTICAGASVTMTASGGTSYIWSNSLGSGNVKSITPGGTDTYTVTVSDAYCTTTTTRTITVNNNPSPSAVASTPVCEGGTITFTANGGSTYTWSGPQSYSASGATPSRSNVTTAMAGIYTVTVTNANACSAIATTNTVSINSRPSANVDYISCPGTDGNTTIKVAATGGNAPYQYRLLPGSFGSSNVLSVANGSTNNNIEVRDAANCVSNTLSFNNPMVTPTAIASGDVASTPCGSNGENRYVYVSNGSNLIAVINDQGQDLGTVSGAIWFHSAPTMYNGDAFAKTSWTMHATIQPAGDVELHLPFTTSTYNDLVATAAATANLTDDISSMNDLGATRYWGANEDNVYNSAEGDIVYLRQDHNGTILNGNYAAVYTPGFSEYWLHGSQDLTALPVTLTSLTATSIDNNYIQVNWATALEIDNAGFALERSQDGINFRAIEWIKGAGTTTTERTYSYDDKNLMPGTYYYRLKQVDNDGAMEYSAGMVSATLLPNGTVSVVPNPTTGVATINFPGTKQANVSIRSATGALVKEIAIAPQGSIDISGYADGIYFVTINQDDEQHTIRIVKNTR